jgi:hypothetical protein
MSSRIPAQSVGATKLDYLFAPVPNWVLDGLRDGELTGECVLILSMLFRLATSDSLKARKETPEFRMTWADLAVSGVRFGLVKRFRVAGSRDLVGTESGA